MNTLLGLFGTQEFIIFLYPVIYLVIPALAYYFGKRKGRIEGRLEEIERNRRQGKA